MMKDSFISGSKIKNNLQKWLEDLKDNLNCQWKKFIYSWILKVLHYVWNFVIDIFFFNVT